MSVCLSALLRSQFLFDFDETLRIRLGPESKNELVGGQNPTTASPIVRYFFHHSNAFSMGKSEYHSNKA